MGRSCESHRRVEVCVRVWVVVELGVVVVLVEIPDHFGNCSSVHHNYGQNSDRSHVYTRNRAGDGISHEPLLHLLVLRVVLDLDGL